MSIYFQRPITGSKWYRGNFNLGLMVDSHPRFFSVVVGLIVVEIVIAFKQSAP